MRAAFTRFAREVERFRLLPLLLMAFLPVLLVRAAIIPVAPDAAHLWNGELVGDVNSWWKAVFVIGGGLWMLLWTLVRLAAGWRPRRPVWGVMLAAAAGATLLSAFLSPYPHTAWLGYSTLYEGAWALLAYLMTAWYAAETLCLDSERRLLLRSIGLVGLIEGVHGVLESFGWSLWQTGPGRWLMGAGEAALTFRFADSRMAYGTVYQPNHYGMLMAMLGALALGMTFREKGRGWRIFWGCSYLFSLGGAFCSNSRAATLVLLGVSTTYAVLAIWGWMGRKGKGAGREIMAVAALLVAATGLLLFVLPRATLTRLGERLTAGWSVAAAVPAVNAVGLSGDRITIRLRDGECLGLERASAHSWRIEEKRARRIATGEDRGDGWLSLAAAREPEIRIDFKPLGTVNLCLPDTTLKFYAIGTRLWWVDGLGGRLWPEVAPSSYIPSGQEGYFHGRGYIWRRALEAWRMNPFFGTGPGTLAQAFPNDDLLNRQRYSLNAVGERDQSNEDKGHGIWATFLVQVGLVGFLLFGLPVLYVAYLLMKTRIGVWKPLLMALAGYLLSSLTNDSTVGVTPLFCVLAGLALANAQPTEPSRPTV